MSAYILLLEDDEELASLTSRYLRTQGFEVEILSSLKAIQAYHNFAKPDLLLCDVMLPDGNSFDIFPFLERHFPCPIIFLTALDEDKDQITGLNIGACDYLVKPIHPEVLLAKINAILRAIGKVKTLKMVGGASLDDKAQQLHVGNTVITLNSDEVKILHCLFSNYPNHVSRESLFNEVLARMYDGLDRAVDLKVSRLRKKLQKHGVTEIDFVSHRGLGYYIKVTA
ncbi:response regulator transcription factor [Pseudoalteromonas fenneropenaei]|uniref:Response regulator transcription factor n=1 Tax=Pseudoalteromonas fenneropenaei TaxID=1737459 RepID=A0ABV7CEW3_9GAMM